MVTHQPTPPSNHGTSTANAQAPRSNLERARRFGRLFPDEECWTLGDPVRDLDACDKIAAAMHAAGSQASQKLPAGFTYLGQFIDHDITFDPTSIGERAVDLDELVNFRTPALDLDSIYGSGPAGQPYLYVTEPRTGIAGPFDTGRFMAVGPVTFVPTAPGNEEESVRQRDGDLYDLPRSAAGLANKRALIADPRNDENLLVAQLHRSFLHFHNAVAFERPDLKNLKAVRLEVMRHYQWMLLHEFLPAIAGQAAVDAARKERRFYKVGPGAADPAPYIPLEFSGAAYRFGHSMVRDTYHFNTVFKPGTPTNLIFTFTGRGGFRSGDRYPTNWLVDWAQFFDGLRAGTSAQRAMRIDPALSGMLSKIPVGPTETRPLAALNLERAFKHYRLPSGQKVALRMGIKPLTPAQLKEGIAGVEMDALGLTQSTPLWLYLLKEAELQHAGEQLGDVGGTIVAEVFVGLLAADPESILSHPEWRPEGGNFGMADLFRRIERNAGQAQALIPTAGVINPLG
ncbi:peroxidase family protein [Acidovorax facilis]|uniref:peroxidase family protein n=1 Tax=Acidovorax facilis TaxID=12917 RepID=UPI003CE8FAF8